MKDEPQLPPGQLARDDFPRFGLTQFANRFPPDPHRVRLDIGGDGEVPFEASLALSELPRVERTSDFHCVTTWSVRALRWSGHLFSDFYERVVLAKARPPADARFVVFRGQDGYRTSLPLAFLLADGVLLADRLNGEPLGIAHGAPLRLVAPAHYGYKNAKHVKAVEFWRDDRRYRPSALRFMDHPTARVDLEERGRGFPGWFLRYLYRPSIRANVALFRRALERHQRGEGR